MTGVTSDSSSPPPAEGAEYGRGARQEDASGGAPGGTEPKVGANPSRSEPLTALGRRLLQGLVGAGSSDSFHTVRMPSGHVVSVEDSMGLR